VLRPAGLLLAAGLVLADSSIVTLALPEVLRELDTSVGEVAWVLIAFNLALALAAVPGARLAAARPRRAFVAGVLLFALACAGCAAAPSLGVLVAGRVAQGLAGAVVLAGALEGLRVVDPGRALSRWTLAGVVGAAVGPALGGLLTEALSWEGAFAVQVPLALGALAGAGALPRAAAARASAGLAGHPRVPLAPLAALALVSAGLAAALFLLVTMLIEGWRLSPAEAAVTVTVMPLAALLAPLALRRAGARERAAAGAVLLAGGLLALGLLPAADVAWTIAPQVLVGAGLGLSVAALTAVALPRSGALGAPASWTIAARHAGVVAGLLLLTPVFTADLDRQEVATERAGVAALLDARLALTTKIALAQALDDRVDAAEGRLPDLAPAFAEVRVAPGERPALRRLAAGLEDELDRAGTAAFARAFRVAAALALLALVPIAAASWRPGAAR